MILSFVTNDGHPDQTTPRAACSEFFVHVHLLEALLHHRDLYHRCTTKECSTVINHDWVKNWAWGAHWPSG